MDEEIVKEFDSIRAKFSTEKRANDLTLNLFISLPPERLERLQNDPNLDFVEAGRLKEIWSLGQRAAAALIPRATTPGKAEAMFVLLTGARKIAVGTTFAIDAEHLLTTRHNLFDEKQLHNPAIEVSICPHIGNATIPVRVVYTPDPPSAGVKLPDSDDFCILKRTDPNKFNVVIPVSVVSADFLASERPNVTIYHYPIILHDEAKSERPFLVSDYNRVAGASSSNNGEIFLQNLSNISLGSCGGAYVDNKTQAALGMHYLGINACSTTKYKALMEGTSLSPVGLHFGPASAVVAKLEELGIVMLR